MRGTDRGYLCLSIINGLWTTYKSKSETEVEFVSRNRKIIWDGLSEISKSKN